MSPVARTLDLTFRSRALPSGSARYWSHTFAASTVRPALLGVYALGAEWHSLSSLLTEPSVAHAKLNWWQEEITRLTEGRAVHPVSVYLAALPHARPALFEPLFSTLQAVMLEASGVPLESAHQLQNHATALLAQPWRLVSRLAGDDSKPIEAATCVLAQAQYRSHAIRNFRLAARHGRVLFPVDELLQADIENAALASESPGPAVQAYLAGWRERALQDFAAATGALQPAGTRYRHLSVLAAMDSASLGRDSDTPPRPLKDMLLAWSAARRASH